MPSPRLPRQPPTALRSSTRSTTALTARITRPLVPRSGPARSTSRPTNGLRSPATSPTSGPASPVGPPRSGPTSPATPPTSGPASRVTPPRSGPSSPATSQASGASEEGAAVTAAATIPIPEKARPSNAPTTIHSISGDPLSGSPLIVFGHHSAPVNHTRTDARTNLRGISAVPRNPQAWSM